MLYNMHKDGTKGQKSAGELAVESQHWIDICVQETAGDGGTVSH